MRLALAVSFSGNVEATTPVLSRVTDGAMIQTWEVRSPDALAGERVRIVGLENTISDALLRIDFADGRSWVQRLTPAAPEATVPAAQTSSGVAATFFHLGVEHILTGYDHLLFVLGLILITANLRQLVKSITAFTIAHSITLGAATLGLVHVPPKLVEAAIALSIAFLALEIVRARQGKASLAAQAPWLVAFTFGLLHGFGFAGALSEVGMPAGHIPTALLFFNIGVETGQLMFVAVVMGLAAVWRQVRLPLPSWAPLVPAYSIGTIAMFWMISTHFRVLGLAQKGDRMKRNATVSIVAAALCFGAHSSANAQDQAVSTDIGTLDKGAVEKLFPTKRAYSPYAGRNFPTRPFFGDTHLHTSFSMDAGAFGARIGPREAYRFAKGEEVTASSGQPAKLSRPLDFLMVADHAENMGFFPDLMAAKPNIMADPIGRKWHDMIEAGQGAEVAVQIIVAFSQGKFPKALIYSPESNAYHTAWQEEVNAAEEANDPGRFTAFIGYEWTSNTGGNNLHRNIVFRDGGEKASRIVPFTAMQPFGSDNPRDLWKWMANYEDKTGGRVLAIPHNGNLSNGRMFPTVEPGTGRPIDREYAETRAKWERLYEATQIKGDGETHPFLSPNDEFANFERWDKGNLDLSEAKTPEMLQYEYARSALKLGLKLEGQIGVNPYKFGMIGSTDSHTGLAAVEEDNYFGKTSAMEPKAGRSSRVFVKGAAGTLYEWETSASGYAAVWATENTREALFDAMERREAYATTGPRMIVRFFGGFDFDQADATTRSPAVAGYSKGVPMGGDIGPAPTGGTPSFLVAALKDPIGANLDRYQIIKGWVDAKGDMQEKVYDVAWSNGRQPGPDGKLPPVGTTVDAANANWTNTIGAPELIAVWKDPDFDPKQRAFYYGRVLEIPTPRWTTYDAKYYGLKLPPEIPTSIQERAYTSPIWYSPGT